MRRNGRRWRGCTAMNTGHGHPPRTVPGRRARHSGYRQSPCSRHAYSPDITPTRPALLDRPQGRLGHARAYPSTHTDGTPLTACGCSASRQSIGMNGHHGHARPPRQADCRMGSEIPKQTQQAQTTQTTQTAQNEPDRRKWRQSEAPAHALTSAIPRKPLTRRSRPRHDHGRHHNHRRHSRISSGEEAPHCPYGSIRVSGCRSGIRPRSGHDRDRYGRDSPRSRYRKRVRR